MGADDGHQWMSELRDIMFSAEPVGSGVEVIVDRFCRYEEEEKKREVMGLSTLRRAQELERLVSQGEAHRNGMNDAELASHLLATKQALKAKWGKYTRGIYMIKAKRFERTALAIMESGRCGMGDLHCYMVWAGCAVSPQQLRHARR